MSEPPGPDGFTAETGRDQGRCDRRLTALVVDAALRVIARARFADGGPDELRAALESVEAAYRERAAARRIALDEERNSVLARDHLSSAYRGLLTETHLSDAPTFDAELAAAAAAVGFRALRNTPLPAGREPRTGPGTEEAPIVSEAPAAEDVPTAWLLRPKLRYLKCVQKTRGFLDTTFEDDDMLLTGVARYGVGPSSAPGAPDRDLRPFAHVFDVDGDDVSPDRPLDDYVVIVPGTTHYLAQHVLVEEDLAAPKSPIAAVLARALGTIVSLSTDVALALLIGSLQEDVDDETDPAKKARREAFLRAAKAALESEPVTQARDELSGVVTRFFQRVFEDDRFALFTSIVEIEWTPGGRPVWRTASVADVGVFDARLRVAALERQVATLVKIAAQLAEDNASTEAVDGANEQVDAKERELALARLEAGGLGRRAGAPGRVVGSGESRLAGIRVAEMGAEIGEYVVDLGYEMVAGVGPPTSAGG